MSWRTIEVSEVSIGYESHFPHCINSDVQDFIKYKKTDIDWVLQNLS